MEFSKVLGRRNFNFTSKKDGTQHTACILGVAKKNTAEGSIGSQLTEYFIDAASKEVYDIAMSLKVSDEIFPLERIVGNQKFLMGIEVKK